MVQIGLVSSTVNDPFFTSFTTFLTNNNLPWTHIISNSNLQPFSVLVLINPKDIDLQKYIQYIRNQQSDIFICLVSENISAKLRYLYFQMGMNMVTTSFDHFAKGMETISKRERHLGPFTCPFCLAYGFTEDTLWDHCPLYHINERNRSENCPICLRHTTKFQVHLRNAHGPCGRGEVHSEFNQEDTILSCFSLVVCRHPLTGAFLVVQEFANSGFWLPGGRVDSGEDPKAAAIRETKEEAGMDIKLTGILRIEYTPKKGTYVRMRFVFVAEPVDMNQIPKTVPDYESVGAAWVTIDELKDLALRGPEPTVYFPQVASGYPIAPLSSLITPSTFTHLSSEIYADLGLANQKRECSCKKEFEDEDEPVLCTSEKLHKTYIMFKSKKKNNKTVPVATDEQAKGKPAPEPQVKPTPKAATPVASVPVAATATPVQVAATPEASAPTVENPSPTPVPSAPEGAPQTGVETPETVEVPSTEPAQQVWVEPPVVENADGRTEGTTASESKASKKKKKKAEANQKEAQEVKKKTRSRRHGDIMLKNERTITTVLKYQMGQSELKKMKAWFMAIDKDASGTIDFDEFFEHIDEKRTNFTEGLFRLADVDGSGTVDYEEFVLSVTSYCMFTRDEVLKFAYDTFDVDGSGSIDEDEFRRLCSVVNNGKPSFPGNFKRAITEFDRDGDGLIDFEEFQHLNMRYPMLLFPCFRLQDRLQKATLGEQHWLLLHRRFYLWLKLQIYKRKHNGAEPPMTSLQKFKRLMGIGVLDIYQP